MIGVCSQVGGEVFVLFVKVENPDDKWYRFPSHVKMVQVGIR